MSLPVPSSKRQLGRDGPEIPAIGFGLMGMSIGYGPAAYVNVHDWPSEISLANPITDQMKNVSDC